MSHRTELSYNAGLRTWKVHCESCGKLRGFFTTKREALARGAEHRREMAEAGEAS